MPYPALVLDRYVYDFGMSGMYIAPVWHFFQRTFLTFEPAHDKTNKMACAPSEDSVK